MDLAAAETELRELRLAGAVFGSERRRRALRDRPPGTSGARLLLSDATAALDYDIAADVLEKLDADLSLEELEEDDPFEEGDLGCWPTWACPKRCSV